MRREPSVAQQQERQRREQETKPRVGRGKGPLSGTAVAQATLQTPVNTGTVTVKVADASWDDLANAAVFGANRIAQLEQQLTRRSAEREEYRRQAEDNRRLALA